MGRDSEKRIHILVKSPYISRKCYHGSWSL
uniref:Uncharacterized protein n=1 Tax=Arundo donax TaxID=35708 RepID=A0A0A9AJZ6_ARUDO